VVGGLSLGLGFKGLGLGGGFDFGENVTLVGHVYLLYAIITCVIITCVIITCAIIT